MTPREVIADAVCLSFYEQPLAYVSEFRRDICHKMADAVIAAMGGTELLPLSDDEIRMITFIRELERARSDAG